MKKAILTITILLSCLTSQSQTITERLILTDDADSLCIKSNYPNFDKEGNYCFKVTKEGRNYFITNKDTSDGFEYSSLSYGVTGEIMYTSLDEAGGRFYYKNAKGVQIYDSAIGKIEGYKTSHTRENISITTSLRDSVYFYINGKLISANHKDKMGATDENVAFSENGNVIYSFKLDSLFYLYVNDKLIDSSKFDYLQLAINNAGDYVFARGYKPEKPFDKYNYLFYIHSNDTVLGYARTVWKFELKENGAYYYSGDDNGPDYLAINDKLYKNIYAVSTIVLLDKNNFMFSFEDHKNKKVNVNDSLYTYKLDEVLYPSLDKDGNFAFYGLEKYYLFTFVNGKNQKIQSQKMEFEQRRFTSVQKGNHFIFLK